MFEEFRTAEDKVNALLNSDSVHGMVCLGPPGVGKTFTVTKMLESTKTPYFCISSYSTPLQFYINWYQNRDKVMVFDDAAGVLDNKKIRSMLLAGLWSTNGEPREVQYNSSTSKLEEQMVPTRFSVENKIIWCTNKIPKGNNAIKSRCYFQKFDWTFEQKQKLFKDIFKLKETPVPVQEFLMKKCTRFCINFDFRLINKVTDYFKICHNNWLKLAESEVEYDDDLYLVEELANKYKGERAIKEFVKRTGMSRRTYFVYKRKIGLSRKYL